MARLSYQQIPQILDIFLDYFSTFTKTLRSSYQLVLELLKILIDSILILGAT